jgi:hypothetical protein
VIPVVAEVRFDPSHPPVSVRPYSQRGVLTSGCCCFGGSTPRGIITTFVSLTGTKWGRKDESLRLSERGTGRIERSLRTRVGRHIGRTLGQILLHRMGLTLARFWSAISLLPNARKRQATWHFSTLCFRLFAEVL